MAAQNNNNGNGLGKWIAVGILMMAMMTLALMPAKFITAAWEGERRMTSAVGSTTFDKWIALESDKITAGWGEAANAAMDSLGRSSTASILNERIYVAFVWLKLIAYRAMSLVFWLLIGIPFVFAAAIDGFYVREIRKESFIAQSPIRHKLGSSLMQHSTFAILVWILIPTAIPPVIAPMLILLASFACWIWLANLQKRI